MAPVEGEQTVMDLMARLTEGHLQQNQKLQKLTETMNSMATQVIGPRKTLTLSSCPKMKVGENLDTWIQEVKLWETAFPGEEAQKYLKFREMIKETEVCPDVKKFVNANIADNETFDKSGDDIIKRALDAIKKGLGKTDLEKSNNAWNTFVTIKQRDMEPPKDFVNRFEEATTALKNATMKQEEKTLAIHLLRSSNLSEASKENILTKVDMKDHTNIFKELSKAMREIKTMTSVPAPEEVKTKGGDAETFYSAGNRKRDERHRSPSRSYRDGQDYNNRRRYGQDSDSRRGGDFKECRRGGNGAGDGKRRSGNDSRDRNGRSNRNSRERNSRGSSRNSRDRNRKDRSESRTNYSKKEKPWRTSGKSDYSDQVYNIHYTPYDDNLELIQNVIDDECLADDESEHLKKKTELVEMIYKEGNNDIDPSVAIVDTGCLKTVAGRPWMDSYIQSIKADNRTLKFRREELKFRFGNGPVYKSRMSWAIEVKFGKLKTVIFVAVVEADVPLLLGLDYQEKWGIVLDVQEGTLKIKATGETFKVKTSRTNHWKLKLQHKSLHEEASNLVYNVNMEDMNRSELKKHIVKVHKNLGHKSQKQLLLLFKMAEKNNSKTKEAIEEVVEECSICRKYKKTPPRPKIAMSKATTSNEVISLDLKEFNKENKYVLYMVDEFSGYMKGKVINDKKPDTVIKAFNKSWIEEGPGIPSRGTMTDNGGEFKNPEFKEMAAKFGLKISLTAGNSPWSNGKCERNHYSADRTIQKLREDNPHMSLEDALSAAIYVHNLQVNKTGFSPRQVTFGQQGVVPGIGDATMEPAIESDAVRKLIIYRQKAEEIYRRIDSSERIQKAIAQQAYGYQDNIYHPGDSVLFKEEGKDCWAGPAKVSGSQWKEIK